MATALPVAPSIRQAVSQDGSTKPRSRSESAPADLSPRNWAACARVSPFWSRQRRIMCIGKSDLRVRGQSPAFGSAEFPDLQNLRTYGKPPRHSPTQCRARRRGSRNALFESPLALGLVGNNPGFNRNRRGGSGSHSGYPPDGRLRLSSRRWPMKAPRPSDSLRRSWQRLGAIFLKSGAALTIPQVIVLRTLFERGPLKQTELVKSAGIDRSSASSMIVALSHRGMVAMVRHEDDARAKLVSLTPLGRTVLNRADGALVDAESALMRLVAPADRVVFLRGLRAIAEAK